MVRQSRSPENFWQELKRRKVIRVTTVYAAVAFGILQLADIITGPLELPSWTLKLIIILLSIGLIITILVSWIYDVTPSGVRKTKSMHDLKHKEINVPSPTNGWRIATVVSILIIVTLIGYNILSRNKESNLAMLEKSVAILPFLNDSPSDSTTYFINGIMDEVLNNLQAIKDLRVVSRTSVEQFRGHEKPMIPEIAKRLNVNYIVEGSGQKYGSKIRMRVQLIEAPYDKHLWAKSYESEINDTKDIFRLQSDIAQTIAAELKTIITPEEKTIIEKSPSTSLSAYDYYQRGRDEHINYWLDNNNTGSLRNAVKLYGKALENDPAFARAYSGLALAYVDKNTYSASSYFSKNYLDSALLLADRALSFDNQLAEAYYARAAYYFFNGNMEIAEKEAFKALEYNPNYWEVYRAAGMMFLNETDNLDFVKGIECLNKTVQINRGRELPMLLRDLGQAFGWYAGFTDKASAISLEAFKLDGDSALYFNWLAKSEWLQGNFKRAADYYNKCYVLDPGNIDYCYLLGECYILSGSWKESLFYYQKYAEGLQAAGGIRLGGLHRIGYAYLRNGLKKEAAVYFAEQKKQCEESISMNRLYAKTLMAYYDLAGIYALEGAKEKAFENLRNWSKLKLFPLWFVTLIKNDPLFENIRAEKEFQQILKDIETKYQAEHERVGKWMEEKGML